MTPEELQRAIEEACNADPSVCSLTQEVLADIALLVRTEPHLFSNMIRIRTGLIIQTLALEVQRALRSQHLRASPDPLFLLLFSHLPLHHRANHLPLLIP